MFSLTFFRRSTDVAVKTSRWARRTFARAKTELPDLLQPDQLLDGRGQAPPGRFFRPFAAAGPQAARALTWKTRVAAGLASSLPGPGDWQVISQGGNAAVCPSPRQAASCCNSPAIAAASDGKAAGSAVAALAAGQCRTYCRSIGFRSISLIADSLDLLPAPSSYARSLRIPLTTRSAVRFTMNVTTNRTNPITNSTR